MHRHCNDLEVVATSRRSVKWRPQHAPHLFDDKSYEIVAGKKLEVSIAIETEIEAEIEAEIEMGIGDFDRTRIHEQL